MNLSVFHFNKQLGREVEESLILRGNPFQTVGKRPNSVENRETSMEDWLAAARAYTENEKFPIPLFGAPKVAPPTGGLERFLVAPCVNSAATCCWPGGISTRDLVHHHLGCSGSARSICQSRPVIINVAYDVYVALSVSFEIRGSSARWTSRSAVSSPPVCHPLSRLQWLPLVSLFFVLLCRIHFVGASSRYIEFNENDIQDDNGIIYYTV